jgi:hypothetical protein
MPFKSGDEWTGNRHGRPRVGETVAEYIRGLAGADGREYVDKLHALATGPHKDTKARLQAIGILLERGWGRPPQELDIQSTTADFTGLTNAELAVRASAILKQLQGATDDDRDRADRPH